MRLREQFSEAMTRLLFWMLGKTTEREVQAIVEEATEASMARLRKAMEALAEADRYFDATDDPVRKELVSTFRLGVMLMNAEVTDLLKKPHVAPDERKERLDRPFEHSTSLPPPSSSAGSLPGSANPTMNPVASSNGSVSQTGPAETLNTPTRRGPGRPRKNPLPPDTTGAAATKINGSERPGSHRTEDL